MKPFSDLFSDAPLFLAPMAGFTDASFRLLCREQGADAATTEMISAKALCYENLRTEALLSTLPAEGPVAVQLFGRAPETMAEAARRVYAAMQKMLLCIDLNMGCPAQKIVKNGEGSALMREPELAERIVRAVADAVPAPVSVKFRKGWDESSVNAVPFAKRMEDAGASFLTIHGRTSRQQYGGRADWEIISEVRRAVRIPVVGNGDVYTGADARRMLEETGCAGVAIGRGALGNPWIFAESRAALSGGLWTPPTRKQIYDMAVRHAEMTLLEKGPHGIIELRKHIGFYLRGAPGAARLRARVQQAKTVEEIREILT